ILSAPMIPHVAETCWEALGHSAMLAATPWPKADPELVKSDTVTIGVQVNGKLRGEIVIPVGASQDAAKEAALALDSVKRALEDKVPKRVIVVPGRIVNVVV